LQAVRIRPRVGAVNATVRGAGLKKERDAQRSDGERRDAVRKDAVR
jgi:hypothetical protein